MCRRDVVEWAPGPNGRANAQCPHCDSLERNRLLLMALDRLEAVFATATTLLDVAPTPGVDVALVRQVGEQCYVGFDLGLDDREVKVLGDLTNMPFPDGSIDVLVAFHVLEHIPDDAAAMAEIRRVLGGNGLGLLQVPLAKGPTDEDPDASIDERIARFGRYDHVRMYGDDWEQRLRAADLGVARFSAGTEFTREELRRANTHGHFSLVSGVADDPRRPAEMVAAVLERRRAAGKSAATSPRPTADVRQLEAELRSTRHELSVTQEAFRQVRRQARRAEETLRSSRSQRARRLLTTAQASFRRVVNDPAAAKARLRALARDPRRLVRRLRRRR